jgi:uncharacterized protein YegL
MKTEIIAILDRSGSMHSIVKDAIGGFNAFLDEQRKVPGEARISVVLFDHDCETVCSAQPIGEAKHLTAETYVPRGNTALLDAIGRAMNEHGKRIADEKWADNVIVCILTDGHENASREYRADAIKPMIEHAEKNGWAFVYLGANQDAFAVASAYGIQAGRTFAFAANAAGTKSAYATMSAATRSLRTQ